MMNPIVFFDIRIGEKKLDRVKIELFAKELPNTCENFRQFCTGEYKENNLPVGYKNSKFHRVIKNFMIQGGDFHKGNGLGSKTIFGSSIFPDESFTFDHTKYAVSMANSGPNTNGCQFFICADEAHHLDGKHVVFGRVVEGFGAVEAINNVQVGPLDTPYPDVVIYECGEM